MPESWKRSSDSMTDDRNDLLAGFFRWAWRTPLVALFASLAVSAASTNDELVHRALEIEAALYGHPQSALLDLEGLVPRADVAPKDARRFVYALYGQAMVLAGKADRKSTRLNSSHPSISYAVFCLKKKKRSTK